jgi:hypothetical protein
MPASRAVAPTLNWLMLVGALCMLAGTLLPVTAPSMGAWSGTHRHITLNGIVPAHTHTYDVRGHAQGVANSCVVADTAPVSASGATQHQEALVCAPETSEAQSVTVTVIHEPLMDGLLIPGFESVATLGPDLAWQDARAHAASSRLAHRHLPRYEAPPHR